MINDIKSNGGTVMKKRLTSKVVWLAVLAQVLIIVEVFIPQISQEVKIVSTALIEIATLFGILNNPTERDKF